MKFPRLFLIALLLALAPLARGQTLEVLHSFNGTNGANPSALLVQGSDGDFYGTTSKGGTNDYGTFFKITTNGILTTLATFENGRVPYAGLIQGNDGSFYGTTLAGGAYGLGTIFKFSSNGLTTLVSFNGTNGAEPRGLLLANDGNFYGTTYGGGSNDSGTVFKMTTNGLLASLVLFEFGGYGGGPNAGLVQGSDGNFYGTTLGGTNVGGLGTVFKMMSNGTLETLVSFGFDGNGGAPRAALVEGSDGSFYGTTGGGFAQPGGAGTVFKITTNGVLTTLVSFDYTNGAIPQSKLVRGNDGCFYGTTCFGGMNNAGTVFKMTADGALTTLVSFSEDMPFPCSGLMFGNDGNLYGTTRGGSMDGGDPVGFGTVFRIIFLTLNSRVSGNELVLSWPTNQVGFTLQSAPNLNSPTNWIDFTNAPAVVGAQFTVTNNLSASAQFYRLKKP